MIEDLVIDLLDGFAQGLEVGWGGLGRESIAGLSGGDL
jgi:hypothetical protein